jgi:predicted dinucleotide-binding enzyme
VARALIVGCGCHGRALGRALASDGWVVRGTSRSEEALAKIEEAGIEPAIADPDRVGSLVELVADVAVVVHVLGAVAVPALHEERLESLLEKLVDTPVRGFVYEEPAGLPEGARLVRAAAERYRLPAEAVGAGRDEADWTARMRAAVAGVIAR